MDTITIRIVVLKLSLTIKTVICDIWKVEQHPAGMILAGSPSVALKNKSEHLANFP